MKAEIGSRSGLNVKIETGKAVKAMNEYVINNKLTGADVKRVRSALGMTQKEFAQKTGIQESTISEWKKNRTNPSSDKILAICKALDVSPEWLLSGVDPAASRGKNQKYYVIDISTDTGTLVSEFNRLDKSQRDRILGYVEAFAAMRGNKH